MDKDDAARVDPLKFARDEKLVLAKFWTKLRDNLHRVPFVEDAVAAFYAATDASTPLKAKAVLLGALAYFIMPFDAVPDVLALVGFSDDLAVLALAIRTVKGHMRAEHYEKARAWLVSHRTGPASAEDIAAGPIIEHEPRPF